MISASSSGPRHNMKNTPELGNPVPEAALEGFVFTRLHINNFIESEREV